MVRFCVLKRLKIKIQFFARILLSINHYIMVGGLSKGIFFLNTAAYIAVFINVKFTLLGLNWLSWFVNVYAAIIANLEGSRWPNLFRRNAEISKMGLIRGHFYLLYVLGIMKWLCVGVWFDNLSKFCVVLTLVSNNQKFLDFVCEVF